MSRVECHTTRKSRVNTGPMRRFAAVACALALALAFTPAPAARAAGAEVPTAAKTAYEQTGAYLAKQTPAYGSEWVVLGLARSEYAVPATYYDTYYANVALECEKAKGVLHSKKYTEYSRAVLGVAAAGFDPTNVGGYNLLAPLADFDQVCWQGINGPAWALVALDCRAYPEPAAIAGKTATTRKGLVDYILSKQHSDGGWSLSASYENSDVDITAMVLSALAPYVSARTDVKAASEKGIAWLSKAQLADGGFASSGMGDASETSESASQVVVALSSLGIDAGADTRFIKGGKSAVDALAAFSVAGGGFAHLKGGSLNAMATEQGYYALTAYMRYKAGKSRLYDFADISARKNVTSVTVNAKTVSASTIAKAVKKAGGNIKTVKTITIGAKVKTIKAKAFAKCKKVTKLIVKTTKLTKKSCKNCLKGSKVKTVQVKVAKKKLKKTKKAYKKLFVKKIAGKKATVK